MKQELKELLTLEKCACERKYCDFFAGGIGERGTSFSKKDIEEIIEILPKVEEYLKHLTN